MTDNQYFLDLENLDLTRMADGSIFIWATAERESIDVGGPYKKTVETRINLDEIKPLRDFLNNALEETDE